jgi:hypothetical protein
VIDNNSDIRLSGNQSERADGLACLEVTADHLENMKAEKGVD